jgi:hypothetical protein
MCCVDLPSSHLSYLSHVHVLLFCLGVVLSCLRSVVVDLARYIQRLCVHHKDMIIMINNFLLLTLSEERLFLDAGDLRWVQNSEVRPRPLS